MFWVMANLLVTIPTGAQGLEVLVDLLDRPIRKAVPEAVWGFERQTEMTIPGTPDHPAAKRLHLNDLHCVEFRTRDHERAYYYGVQWKW
jgi:hypothetical protein